MQRFAPSIAEAVAAYGWPSRSASAARAQLSVLAAESWGPALSPDARRVAFISNRGGAPRAFVTALDASVDRPALELDTGGEPVVELSWSPDGQWIACLIAPGGSVRQEVWLIRPDGTDLKLAAGAAHGSAFLGDWTDSGQLAVTHTGVSADDRRAHLIEPNRCAATQVAAGELLLLLDVSPDEQALLLRHGPRNARWLSVARPGQPEQPLLGGELTAQDIGDAADGSSDLGHFSADGRALYVRSDVGRERAGLFAVSLADGTGKLVAERGDAELEGVAISRDRRVLVLLWNTGGGRSELSRFDPASGVESPLAGPPGQVLSGLCLSQDGRWLALTGQASTQPKNLWLIDLSSEQCVPVTRTLDAPVALASSEPELHHFRAADGVGLSGWLYRAGPAAGGPVVIHLHGGPEAQERPVWNPLFNQLRARGLSVFAPNVRGSSGFGRAFVHADNRERRVAAIDDVKACVDYLVESGIAEPGRVGCAGRSYGGYLTLAALVQYPKTFAVGVDTCGMADLLTFYERTEPWIAAQAVSKYGHPERDRELLRALSPLHRFDRLATPLLVVHGAHDTNVPLHEAEQVIQALAARNLPGAFLLFSDEGHEIVQWRNLAMYIEVLCDWLGAHLMR